MKQKLAKCLDGLESAMFALDSLDEIDVDYEIDVWNGKIEELYQDILVRYEK